MSKVGKGEEPGDQYLSAFSYTGTEVECVDSNKAECLKTNLVLLGKGLLTDEEFRAFGDKIEGEVQLRNLIHPKQIVDAPHRIIVVPKQRIVIGIQDERSSIECEYPDNAELSNFAKIIRFALEESKGLEVRSHGYNADFTCKQVSFPKAHQYIANRVLRSPDIPGWDLREGGTASLRFYDEEERRWTVEVAPRFNLEDTDAVFLSFNLHVEGAPNSDDIENRLELVWQKAHAFIDALK